MPDWPVGKKIARGIAEAVVANLVIEVTATARPATRQLKPKTPLMRMHGGIMTIVSGSQSCWRNQEILYDE